LSARAFEQEKIHGRQRREENEMIERLRNLMGLFLHTAKKTPREILERKSEGEIEELAQIISEMAVTGIGTDLCLKHGCLPMPVNFYSPVPDLKDLEQRRVWERQSSLAGIAFRQEDQVRFLLELGKTCGHECQWPKQPTEDPFQFHTENNSFGFGCAAVLHSMIRHFKPRRIIEIGSGNSSLVASAALKLNREENPKMWCDYTIIDPYPNELISGGSLPGLTRVVAERVELAGEFFTDLRENDILFIDSSHTVRIGGDVNYLILDVLPRLAPGVIVHFHDIGLPYEYPRIYFTNPQFRVFWTEAYLLQAFLACNEQFEILLAMSSLMTERGAEFRRAYPYYSEHSDESGSGSFWIRRKVKDLRD
jgi:hypothetical protein